MIIEVTEDNLLTWELQLRREGTLPPEVQVALVEWAQQHIELFAFIEED